MIKQLQGLLDRQASALDARDPSIRSIRRELDLLLETLQSEIDADVAVLEPKLLQSIEKHENLNKKIQSSQKELEDIETGATAVSLDETRVELQEVEKQLELLLNRKQTLQESLKNQTALLDGQRNRLRELVASLRNQNLEFDTAATTKLETKLNELKNHSKASIQGRELWKTVCADLDIIDSQISSSADLAASLVALENAAGKLYGHLEVAKSNNWQLMVTAIGHEYAAIDQALELVRRVVAKP